MRHLQQVCLQQSIISDKIMDLYFPTKYQNSFLTVLGEAAAATEGEPRGPVKLERGRKPEVVCQGRRARAREEVGRGQAREGQGGLRSQVGEAPGGKRCFGRSVSFGGKRQRLQRVGLSQRIVPASIPEALRPILKK